VASYTHSTGKIGSLVELLCETDFVARNDEFVALANGLCLQVVALEAKNAKELVGQDFIKDSSVKVGDLVKELGVKFWGKYQNW